MFSYTDYPPAAIKFVEEGRGHVHIRSSVIATSLLSIKNSSAIESNEVLSLTEPSPLNSQIRSRELARGLAAGTFSRPASNSNARYVSQISVEAPPTESNVASGIPEYRRAITRMANAAYFWISGIVARIRQFLPQQPTPLLPNDDVSDVLSTPLLGMGDPRIPFRDPAGTDSRHIVDLPASIDALPTVLTLRFEVEDDGVGLTTEQLTRLFKPYSQVCFSIRRIIMCALLRK